MMTPANRDSKRGIWRTLNALVYCLIVLAVVLGGIATWRRYSHRRASGEPLSDLGDTAERQIAAFGVDPSLTDGLIRVGGLPRYTPAAPMGPFICRQCQSRCWMPPGRGRPACPFCGRVMTRQALAISPAGGVTAAGNASPVAIRPDAIRPHSDRGVCTNCHSIFSPGDLRAGLTPAAAAVQSRNLRPAPRGALSREPAVLEVAPNAMSPILIKELGIEVGPGPGSGAQVTGVMGNSYASNAGLRPGDVIIECNQTRVRSAEQLQRLVSLATPETDAQIRIMRDGRARDVLIMVGEGEMEGFTPIRRP